MHYEELTPYIYYAGRADVDVVAMSKKMAEQADVPYMVKSDVASGGSYNYAASCGIPSVTDRAGADGRMDTGGGLLYEKRRS